MHKRDSEWPSAATPIRSLSAPATCTHAALSVPDQESEVFAVLEQHGHAGDVALDQA